MDGVQQGKLIYDQNEISYGNEYENENVKKLNRKNQVSEEIIENVLE